MKVVIVVEGGVVAQVHSDVAHCEVQIIDCDTQDEREHADAERAVESLEVDPSMFQIA